MNISVFKSLDSGSKPIKTISIDEALQIIKNHPKKNRILAAKKDGKGNQNKIYPKWSKDNKESIPNQRNLYDHVKSTEIQTVAWNCVIKDSRKKSNIDTPSGYIYCDVDDFQNLLDSGTCSGIGEARDYVWNILTDSGLGFIKAVWRSFGGNGFGFLVKTEKLTIDNFKSTWLSLESLFNGFGIRLDAVTKDITRPNVLAYDPEIFVRDDKNLLSYTAVEPIIKNLQLVKVEEMTQDVVFDILSHQLAYSYKFPKNWTGNRLNYGFYFHFFVAANHKGIDLYKALDFLIQNEEKYPQLFSYRNVNEVESILRSVESNYAAQSGEMQIEIPEHTPLKDKYTIKRIYQRYEGDVTLKLDYLCSVLKGKKPTFDKLVNTITYLAKNTGISSKKLTDFLINKFKGDFNDTYLNIIDEIYRNHTIHYGIVKELTDEAIAERKRSFQEYADNSGYELVKSESFTGKLDKKLKNIIDGAKNVFKDLNLNNVTDFLSYIFKKTKGLAIKTSDVLEYLEECYGDTDESRANLEANYYPSEVKVKLELNREILRKASFVSKEVYNYNPWEFGWRLRKIVTQKTLDSWHNIYQNYTLAFGMHVSDLNLLDIDNKILWGNTNQGKTTWICEHRNTKRLVLVPVITLLEGIQSHHNATVFYEETKNVSEGDELIVCTYSSFPTLFKIMQKWKEVKVSDYELFFDEEHNLVTSSNSKFRGFELNSIIDCMHVFKSRTFLTGTLIPVLHPVFKNFQTIRVNWEEVPPKYFKRIRFKNMWFALESKLSREGKNVIYLQNKKEEGKLGTLIDYLSLKGWDRERIWCVNADEKDSDHFKRLVNNEWIDDEIDIIICTSVIGEGANIYNKNMKTIHFASHEGIAGCEQFVNRFRKVYDTAEHDCMIYWYKSIETEDECDSDHVNIVELQKQMIEIAQNQLDMFDTAYITGDSVCNKITNKLFSQNMFANSAFFRIKDGHWTTDFLSIANMAYIEETKYAYKDIEFAKLMLSQYNWQFLGDEIVLENMNENDKKMLDDARASKKETLMEDVLKIMATIQTDGEDLTLDKISDHNVKELQLTERPAFEVGLRSKIKYLVNNMSFNDAYNLLLDWVVESKMSEKIWQKITRQINVQIATKLQVFENCTNITNDFAKSLIDHYKTQKKKEKEQKSKILLTKLQLTNLVKTRMKLNITPFDVHEENVIDVLSKYFDVKSYVIGDSVKYHLAGIKISNDVINFTNRLKEWAMKCFDENIFMTSQQLADKLNHIRKDLPLLSMYKLNSKNAMKLVHDFFGFERISAKKDGKKTKNTYKFTTMFATEIANITIIPLRKVATTNKHLDDMTYSERQTFNETNKQNSLTYYLNLKAEDELVPF